MRPVLLDMQMTVRGGSLYSCGLQGARLGNPSTRPSSQGPGRKGNQPCRSGPTKVLEGSTMRWCCTQPRNWDKPAGRNESERLLSPVSVYPAVIAARAGIGVAEPQSSGEGWYRRWISRGYEIVEAPGAEGGSM